MGKGSYGRVIQVRKIDSGKIYALKVLNKDDLVNTNQVQSTKTERRVLEVINHPFIVKLHFAFQSNDKLVRKHLLHRSGILIHCDPVSGDGLYQWGGAIHVYQS